jgi:membrane protease YdiL (CAAX protease family)
MVATKLSAQRAGQPDFLIVAVALVLTFFLIDGFVRRELYAISPSLYWAFDFLKFVVLPAAAAICLARAFGVRPEHYGIRGVAQNETWVQFIGLTFFVALLLAGVHYATYYVAWFVLRPEVAQPFYQEINPAGILRVPAALYMAGTAAVVEEVFCRGIPLLYLQRRFPNGIPEASYVWGTALLFGFLHWENGFHDVVAAFVFGLAAAAIYLKLRDLWPLMGGHFVIGLVALW